jgi:hypothetical protein
MRRRLSLLCLFVTLLGAGLILATASAAAATVSPPEHAWRWPLSGHPTVVRRFQPPPSPYAAGHRGVDLAAAQGTAVLAAGAGVVHYAGLVAGRGVVTVLHQSGLTTEYEPVRASVRAGQRVTAGAVLGAVSGRHLGCVSSCLHWGARRGATYIDPLSLLFVGPVRLLPLDRAVRPPGHGPVLSSVGNTPPLRALEPSSRTVSGLLSSAAAPDPAAANPRSSGTSHRHDDDSDRLAVDLVISSLVMSLWRHHQMRRRRRVKQPPF